VLASRQIGVIAWQWTSREDRAFLGTFQRALLGTFHSGGSRASPSQQQGSHATCYQQGLLRVCTLCRLYVCLCKLYVCVHVCVQAERKAGEYQSKVRLIQEALKA
jgi:hypothetical protein